MEIPETKDTHKKNDEVFFFQWVQLLQKYVDGSRIMVIGSEKGNNAILLENKGYEVTGIAKEEIDVRNSYQCLEKETYNKNVTFQALEKMKHQGNPAIFDAVILEEPFNELSNIKNVSSLAYKLLKHEGKLIFVRHLYASNNNLNMYLPDIICNLESFFIGEFLKVNDHYLNYVGSKRKSVDVIDTLDDLSSDQLVRWMNVIGEGFSKLHTAYGDLLIKYNKQKQILNRARQKIFNLTSNSSIRYKIGDSIIRARKSWKEAVRLPVTLYRLYNEVKGNHRTPLRTGHSSNLSLKHEKINSSGNGIVFLPTNGAGLGHLTRLLAIARRLRDLDSSIEIIFFSTSSAMHLILQEGFLGYHLPSKMLFPENMTARQWNNLLEEYLENIIELHQPSMLVFDGAYPYAGLVSSFQKTFNLQKIWIKRGHHKQGTAEKVQSKEKEFNKVIIPGEAGINSLGIKDDKKYYCEPIIYLDKSELLTRDQIRNQWNIPPKSKLIYVQLGAGNINDINSTIQMILSELKKREDVYVVIGESIIGKRLDVNENRVMILRDYPNSMYFNAFDLAITAAGYNTFHELLYFGLPSILIPNENTKTDDQVARAMVAQNAGAAIVLREPKLDTFVSALEEALEPEINFSMRKAAEKLVKVNGADQVAQLLLNIVSVKK